MVNKECEKPEKNLTFTRDLIVPILATYLPQLARFYLTCDTIPGGL
jgi:hypothetical protein